MQNSNYRSPQIQHQFNQQSSPIQVPQIENNQYNQEIKSIQYPPLNQVKETSSIDNQKSEEIISNDYLQQQNQGQNPPIQQLIQPFIHQIQPIVYLNDQEMTIQKKKRLNKENQYMDDSTAILSSSDYGDLFFDSSNNEYRISSLVIFVLTFAFLLFVRFGITYKKTRRIQFIIYATFCFLYTYSVSSVVSAGYANSKKDTDTQNFAYYLSGLLFSFGSILGQIILIQVHFQIKKFNEEQMSLQSFIPRTCCGSICILFGLLVFFGIVFGGDLEVFYMIFSVLFFMMIWSLVFTLFYISSLLQIYRGKFKLQEDQHIIGSVLAFVNMFFLYI